MMEPPEEYGFDFDQVEENFDDFMDDEEAMVIFLSIFVCYFFHIVFCFYIIVIHSNTLGKLGIVYLTFPKLPQLCIFDVPQLREISNLGLLLLTHIYIKLVLKGRLSSFLPLGGTAPNIENLCSSL